MESSQVLVKPLFTEKTLSLSDKGRYTFVVALKANKYQIKKALKDMFNVDVKEVRTMIVKGALKRVGKKRLLTKQSNYKKAIVLLKKDQKLDLFDQEPPKEEGK
ncbi:MAG: 50S ribosomal protein L23 [Candidatus Woykebacteria bacterium RIFCSPHIGHO2_12_FULL_43_10]|uniref:Large ribosomal subunit protein uL23 n=2 Tax=Candidatus Woykeibacteriota TaxID=1817899 RepID=A0A1G1WZ70_9BACT|nr:MAG: 50S ribosomal protein L23 [Candidatus Woykebacteria bacterium RIFCSPHIGHO2_01_FULL_43_29]OGY28698.1 MAG: 50S ribosomal protein L23 [Candidatus Woykebacteria bacterium RIFCSPHIGHO2_02_FULL_43_16b]OGY29773.1 MAG: 50S ribosomal protein L23 [Candidatus Woykebacteria bacterium RIFCSPHIGHO2_12_FULL_43_10]OGY32447.1 MAG: 50S ribosomal protein L23 [Candidatus Woykebacteria bacterium RIFCSPLOWO2_01_FULL_43_14]